MALTILDNVKRIFLNALSSLDLMFMTSNSKNKNSRRYGTKRVVSPRNSRNDSSKKKKVLSYKGSAYNGIGGVNKDAVMFNRFRKDRPHERHS